jgi:hypothetical protein
MSLPRLLLDTHVLLWWLAEPERLGPAVADALADPGAEVLVSAASAWEIATRHRIGKLPSAAVLLEGWQPLLDGQGFVTWPSAPPMGSKPGVTRCPIAIPTATRKPMALIACWRPRRSWSSWRWCRPIRPWRAFRVSGCGEPPGYRTITPKPTRAYNVGTL